MEQELSDIISEVTQKAFLTGYRSALRQVVGILPTDRKTIDIIKLKLILQIEIDSCEEKMEKGDK